VGVETLKERGGSNDARKWRQLLDRIRAQEGGEGGYAKYLIQEANWTSLILGHEIVVHRA
jgi:hypothetical protein